MWKKYFEIGGYTVYKREEDGKMVYSITKDGDREPKGGGGYYRLSALLNLKGL
jgi:hypothetical protein